MKTAATDEATYVTWAECFHPENATVTFSNDGNPLWTVYEGAREEIPVAHAVPVSGASAPVHDLGQVEAQTYSSSRPQPSAPFEPNNDALTVPHHAPPVFTGTGKEPSPQQKNDDSSHISNESMGLDLLLGCTLSWVTVIVVCALELTGWLLYFVSAGFWKLTKLLSPPNVFTGLFYSIFSLVYWVLVLVDSILLFVSVLVSELLAAICFLLSSLIGGCGIAKQWHQFIRKTCHKVRWAFRSKLICKDPPRIFCGMNKGKKDELEDGEKENHRNESSSTLRGSSSGTLVPPPATGQHNVVLYS